MTRDGFDWNTHRDLNGNIDLVLAYEEIAGLDASESVIEYLGSISSLQPIKSRQAAAICIVNAYRL